MKQKKTRRSFKLSAFLTWERRVIVIVLNLTGNTPSTVSGSAIKTGVFTNKCVLGSRLFHRITCLESSFPIPGFLSENNILTIFFKIGKKKILKVVLKVFRLRHFPRKTILKGKFWEEKRKIWSLVWFRII